ncbi:MAG: alpha/beta hydrolase [Robiginitomaculum sp.]|nr:alpha/beta hydrolase [Robiginitomaculum sp.]MDQ7078438.1 alpha/beta hydrolase [Robiginitomaculum sp.]
MDNPSPIEVEIEGMKLSLLRQGTAPKTLVFLHGNSGCKDVFFKQFLHFKNTHFSALAIDLPGHGQSDNACTPETTYTIPGYADLIAKLIKALGIRAYILIGWSLGGNIALEMAGAGNAAKGLMIFGAPPVGPGMENIDKAYLPATFETAIGNSQATKDDIMAYVRSIYGTLDPIPETFYQCALRTEGKARQIMVEHWMGGNDGYNQYQTAAQWENPICVVHGEQDPFVSLEYLTTLPWRNLWRDKIFTRANCGHAPFIEAPAYFNTLLEEFAKHVL